MTPAQQREETLFAAAQAEPPAERAAFLDGACHSEPGLRARLDALLVEHEQPDHLLASAAAGVGPGGTLKVGHTTVLAAITEQAGDQIGPYKLREKIGEGGCGVVYVAEQEKPVRRRVALKVIKLGMDTRSVIARFEAERQALAMMDHPNIARVLDAGATETGRPYFVMELVRGIRITDYCDQHNLSTKERLDLFMKVCHAIQHAHQKGIIHRDIKPSNILVTLHDGVPVPKVIDFGIAKATEGRLSELTVYTELHQFIGTPAYMSPEQAEMSGLDIDTRSDIYALGVLLYELLTGQTPFDAQELWQSGLDEIRRTIREVEPAKPSTRLSTMLNADLTLVAKRHGAEPSKFTKLVRGDLDWIVMTCLEKDRTRRYDTANGLAMDIQRHLNNEPIRACPPSTAYRLRKLVRRNKLAVAAGTAIAASLVIGIAVSLWQAVRATRAERSTAAERDNKELALQDSEAISRYLTEVFQSPDPVRDGRTITVAETLDKAARNLEGNLATQPARRAALQVALADTYCALGLPRQGVPLYEKARDYLLATVGTGHNRTLAVMYKLADGYSKAGRVNEAIPLAEEVLALCRKVNGPEHVTTLRSMASLGTHYDEAGRWNEALKLREELLPRLRKVLGPEHLDTLDATHNLAISYSHFGRKDEVLKMCEDMLALRRKINGPEHPDTFRAMHNLARSYIDAGRTNEALQLREEALTLSRKVLGPEHPDTLKTMSSLAIGYDDAGRWDEALKLREAVLALSRKVLGPEHPDTLSAILNLANSYPRLGRKDEALQLREEVLALSSKVNGPEHPDPLKAIHSLGNSYADVGRGDEAVKLLEKLVPIRRRVNGPEDRETLGAMTSLVVAYIRVERLQEALTLQEQALAIKRRVLTPSDPYLAAALHNMARLYEMTGRTEEAFALRQGRSVARSNPSIVATLIPPDSEWKWLHPTNGVDPAGGRSDFHNTFFTSGYDDSAWKTGKDSTDLRGGFGYGPPSPGYGRSGRGFNGVDIGLPPDENHRHSAYFRRRFTTDKPHTHLELRCQRDDAIIVYLDGTEVLRDNLPAGPEAYLLSATIPQGPDNDGVIHRLPIPGTLAPGQHLLAISVHNTELPSSDLRIGGITLVEISDEPKTSSNQGERMSPSAANHER